MRERLRLMREVAQYKWVNHLPIEDLAREQALIEKFVAEANRQGLGDEHAVRKFIREQIEAGKKIQRDHFARWNRAPPSSNTVPRDLQRELRPRIDHLGIQLLGSITRLRGARLHPRQWESLFDQLRQDISRELHDPLATQKLVDSLRNLIGPTGQPSPVEGTKSKTGRTSH